MRALVIGSGIGGPVVATALRRVGVEAVVHEAHDGPAEGLGSFLTLAPNGLAALRTLDLLAPVRSAALFPSTRIEFQNGSGRRLGLLDDGSDELDDGLQTVTVMRGTLQRVLAEAARAQGARIEYGRRLVGFTATDDGVTAEFADGSTAHGDVLIGADGLHSPVRRIMDPAAPRPAYTGLLNLGGSAPPLPVPATPERTMRMVFARRAFFGHQTAADGRTHWFVNFPHPELDRAAIAERDAEQWRRHVLALFADDHPAITQILRASPVDGFRPVGVYDIASLPRWTSGRVALLGDAAHAVSPSSGQGASLAVEDAVLLAACLRDVADPAAALRTYERLRRGRVERIVAEGRRRGGQKLVTSRIGVLLRDLTLPLVFRLIAMRGGHSWMFDHRVDLADPVRETVSG